MTGKCTDFLIALATWVLASMISLSAADKPNIVAIIADDHGVYHSTVYGSAEQKTPHMQSLADEGMTFTRAYVASPSCAPSRHALLSGMMPYRNGVVGNHENSSYKLDVSDSLIQRLLDVGYEVVFRGKVAHGNGKGVVPNGVVKLSGSNNLLDPANVEDYLIKREDKTKPVALFIGPTDTHTIWPSEPNEVHFKPEDTVLPPKTFDTPEARNLMARYNQSVENVDTCVGQVREMVKRQLDVNNTLILYTSDHGQNWPFGKWSLYETGVRAPLIAVWPGKIEPRSTTNAMVSWIDIIPTFLDIAGAPAVEGIDGKSFKPVLLGQTNTLRDQIFTVHKGDKTVNVYPIRAVRTDRWKYMLNLFPEFYNTTHMDVPIFRAGHTRAGQQNQHYFPEWNAWIQSARTNQEAAQFLHLYHARPKEELYLVEEDPFEENNLVFDPRYADVLASMRAKIRHRMQEVDDDQSLSGEPRLLKDNPLPATIKLYFPNGGENFTPGQTIHIRWSNFWKGTETVKLDFHDGSRWNTIDDSTPHDGAYAWQVPSMISKSVRLRVSSADEHIFDESDKSFAITAISNPNGMIDLIPAPEERFEGRIFLINDWDGGDKDNQNTGEELNRSPKIKKDVTILSDLPGHDPKKVRVYDLVKDARILADASKAGKIALAMGAHSRHVLAWLTELPQDAYNFHNIVLVTHSNWNELDGRKGYEAHKQPGDPPLVDSHGVDLRRGLYPSLAQISDLGVTILEIPRTDHGPGGWGGRVATSDSGTAEIKALDISDLGLVHYLKTGLVEATRLQRNAFVSDTLKKPEALNQVNRGLITRYWDGNHDVPGKKEDYLPGGKSY